MHPDVGSCVKNAYNKESRINPVLEGIGLTNVGEFLQELLKVGMTDVQRPTKKLFAIRRRQEKEFVRIATQDQVSQHPVPSSFTRGGLEDGYDG